MSSTKFTLLAIALISFALSATAQNAHVLTMNRPGGTEVTYLPSPGHTFGAYWGSDPLPDFWGGVAAPQFMSGGVAIDQIHRRVLATDGFYVTQESMLRFPPMGAPSGPVPAPVLNTPVNNGITGMSMDGGNGRLFMCDEWSFRVFQPAPPYSPLSSLITPPAGHSQFTGMAYDPSDDTLWFCDIQGGVYHTKINGAPIAGEYPINYVPALLKGICVDRSEGAGTFGTVFWTPNLYPTGRPRIWVTDGAKVIDAITLMTIPISTVPSALGMAFSADGQFSTGGSVAAATGNQPYIRQSRPSANGFGLGCDILLEGAPASVPHYLLYNWFPQPGISLGAGTVRVYSGIMPLSLTDAVGAGSVHIPDVLAGLSLTFQYLVHDPAGTVPWALSDCLTFMSARP